MVFKFKQWKSTNLPLFSYSMQRMNAFNWCPVLESCLKGACHAKEESIAPSDSHLDSGHALTNPIHVEAPTQNFKKFGENLDLQRKKNTDLNIWRSNSCSKELCSVQSRVALHRAILATVMNSSKLIALKRRAPASEARSRILFMW